MGICWKLKSTDCVKSCNCPGTPPPSDFLNVYTPAGRTVGRFCGFSGKDQIEKWSPAIVVEPRKPGRFQVCSKTRPWEMEGFCVECRPGTKSWFQKKKDSVCPHLNFYNSQHNFWNFCLECAGRFQSNRLRFYSLRQLYRLRLVTNHLAFLSTFNSSTSWDRQYSNSPEIIINFLLTYFLNFYF